MGNISCTHQVTGRPSTPIQVFEFTYFMTMNKNAKSKYCLSILSDIFLIIIYLIIIKI